MSNRIAITGLVLAGGLALASCSNPADPAEPYGGTVVVDVSAGRTFEMRPGQIVRLAGTGIEVAFRGVHQDSRCPTDVTCVWEGDAAIRLRVAVGGAEPFAIDLHTALEPKSVQAGDHMLTVVGVSPDPVSDRTIPNERYRVRLRVD